MLFLPPNLHHLSGTAFPTPPPPTPTPTPRCSRKPATNSQSVCCAGHIIARSGFCTLCASSRAVLQIPRDDCQTAERQTIPAREKAMGMPWNDWNAKVKYSLRLHARLFQGLLANRRSCTDRFWPLFLLAAGTGAEARQPSLPCLSGFVSPDRLPPWRLLRAHRRLYGSSPPPPLPRLALANPKPRSVLAVEHRRSVWSSTSDFTAGKSAGLRGPVGPAVVSPVRTIPCAPASWRQRGTRETARNPCLPAPEFGARSAVSAAVCQGAPELPFVQYVGLLFPSPAALFRARSQTRRGY